MSGSAALMMMRRRSGATLLVSPNFASGLHTNSPASLSPSTRTVISSSVTASGGTGSYAWTRISGSTAINADAPSSATTTFSGTVSISTSISATFRCTSGSETFDVPVDLNYESGFL